MRKLPIFKLPIFTGKVLKQKTLMLIDVPVVWGVGELTANSIIPRYNFSKYTK